MIPQETLETLREDSGDVFNHYLPHRHAPTSRGNLSTRCPLGVHDDAEASFSFNPDIGLWNCFACGHSGDVFKLVMELDGVGFAAAVHRVAEITQREVDLGGKRAFNPARAGREAKIRANRRKICDGLRRWHRDKARELSLDVYWWRKSVHAWDSVVILSYPELAEREAASARTKLAWAEFLSGMFEDASGDIAAIGRLFAYCHAPERF